MNTHRLARFISLLLSSFLCLSVIAFQIPVTAETAASTVPELIAQIRNHTEKAEDPFSIKASANIVNSVIKGNQQLLSAIMLSNGAYTAAFEYETIGDVRTVTFKDVAYYPGQKIAAACRTGNTSKLTSREMETMKTAQRFAATLSGSDLDKEKAIHDYLCNTITYQTSNTYLEENDTAVGALLNGRADCDGFADAFSLICSMAGLETRRVKRTCSTDGIKGSHVWNAIMINGKWCFVDVANDNQPSEKIVYMFYNRGTDDIRATHTWMADALDINVVAKTDNSFRNAELAENVVRNWDEFTTVIYEEAAKKPARIGIACSSSFSIYSDSARFASIVYTSGINGADYGQTGNMIELVNISYYDHFKRVSTEDEAVKYLKECKKAKRSNFTMICPADLYQTLMKNNGKKILNLLSKAGFSKREVSFIERYGHIIIKNAK